MNNQTAYRLSAKRGFTFTEVMLTLGLFVVLAGVGVGAYFRYYGFALVDTDIHNTESLLDQARFWAQKNPTSTDYGVQLDPATRTLTLFKTAYVPNAPENQTVVLKTLDIKNLSLNPAPGVTDHILFERQTGKTLNWGSFSIGNSDYTYTFTINIQGVIE